MLIYKTKRSTGIEALICYAVSNRRGAWDLTMKQRVEEYIKKVEEYAECILHSA